MTDGISGYETGPDASVRAAASGWERVERSRAVVLVEGVSDQIAVEATAAVRGLDLVHEGVVVLPLGGAHAIARAVERIRQSSNPPVIAGLCDEAEARFFRRALDDGDVFVCVADLEDELVRAAGKELVEQVLADNGDAQSFATMRAQPAWRGAPFEAQVRRFIAAGARRKHRYASAFVHALGPDRVPAPLAAAVAHVVG